MKNPIQAICREIGESGCYFLSIVRAAEERTGKTINPVAAYIEMKKKKHLGAECFVAQPDSILSELTGIRFSVRHESKDYKAKDGEVEVLRFAWKKSGGGVSMHFVLGDGCGRVAYDPLGDSYTVKHGALDSKRIFTPCKG